MSSTHQQYPLEASPAEVQRLIRQAELLAPVTGEIFRSAGIRAGMRVLDLGSGAGDVAFLVARLVGSAGSVVGVERDPQAAAAARARAAQLQLSNVSFLEQDLQQLSPPGSPFDAMVGRYILVHQSDPAAVLRQAQSFVRSGGVVAFHEVELAAHIHTPSPMPLYDQLRHWAAELHRRLGVQMNMASRLPGVFQQAGLPNPETRLDVWAGGGPGYFAYDFWQEALRSVLPKAQKLGLLPSELLPVETLAERLSAEVASVRGAFVGEVTIGAWTRKP